MLAADVLPALRSRASQGAGRVRAALVPTLEASLAAGLSWLFAYYVLDHPLPFFAPVAAWVCLGFSQDRDVRSVGEVALGVSVGVGLGDLLVHLIGSGVWQIMAVLVAAALIARFLDRARLVAIQAGVQAIVVVGLPATSSNPFGRWTDALTGGVVALLFVALVPRDLRRWPRAAARGAFNELATICHDLSAAVRASDATACHAALVRARATQPLIDDWESAGASARRLARVSPAARRHVSELDRLARAEVYADRAIRNIRVISRRTEVMFAVSQALDAAAPPVTRTARDADGEGGIAADADPHPALSPALLSPTFLRELAAALTALAAASNRLAATLASGEDLSAARREIAAAAQVLAPLRDAPPAAHVVVDLLRSFPIDLAQAAGLTTKQARAVLP